MTFPQRLTYAATAIQQFLDDTLAGYGDATVVQGMRYAVTGGKRLRGFLVIESAALFDVPLAKALPAAAAIEVLHAYSLVHDDLPCMDDDDLRRGQPTVHVNWDEATAVLVGDGLQSLAFELLTQDILGDARVGLLATMAQAAGARGMVLGQALDIAAESRSDPLDIDQIVALQALKTGALIEWSCGAGALLGGSDSTPLLRYARALGLAFQIADDILDVEGDAALAGKRLQKDAAAGKATFVSLLGLEGARSRAAALIDEAEAALQPYGKASESLRGAARFAIARQM